MKSCKIKKLFNLSLLGLGAVLFVDRAEAGDQMGVTCTYTIGVTTKTVSGDFDKGQPTTFTNTSPGDDFQQNCSCATENITFGGVSSLLMTTVCEYHNAYRDANNNNALYWRESDVRAYDVWVGKTISDLTASPAISYY